MGIQSLLSPRSIAIVGASEKVGPGYNYLVTALQWGDLTHDEAMRSMKLYAEEVMPALATSAPAGSKAG